MRSPLRFLVSTLSLAATAVAAAPALNTTILEPWLITRLTTHSPSGYPANHPYSRLSFGISDPNTIVLGETRFGDAAFEPSAVNCTVWWMAYGDVNPRSGAWVNTCDETESVQGKWTFVVLDGSEEQRGVTTDFRLRVTLEEAVIVGTGGVVSLKFEGEAAFKVGENMSGACGGSGVCNWGLKSENKPVEVKQKLVELTCVTGTCE
ncbi:hypothetical protein C7999DRAFT_42456 [Corynascus novoguineensis]|uniref:Uncharacterized protein n=1 Tax=Corynascus novoguineensis TaxID=1126955 RepID=A0AAN7HNH0_9PEZI|nr:hypothetical protein C7999DRAFT_42456 [Corynascus novoguineensis]